MPEIVQDVFTIWIQDIEVPIAFGHGMLMRYVRYRIESIGYFSTLIDSLKTLTGNLGPLCRDAMQGQAFREKLSAHGVGRHDDLGMSVDGHEMFQTSGMVTMAMGDKHIVHRAEVNPQSLRIMNEYVAGSCIEQDSMTLRFQENRKPMLRLQSWVVRAIIHQYRPPHTVSC